MPMPTPTWPSAWSSALIVIIITNVVKTESTIEIAIRCFLSKKKERMNPSAISDPQTKSTLIHSA
jgi:hypothetical protein